MSNNSELKEKFEIFELAYKFSDAANRKDGEMFQALWSDEDAEWIVGKPINRTFSGKENMAMYVTQMLEPWEFFVQMVTSGVIALDGDRAYGRFYIQEIANSKDGSGNSNLSMYEDELIKTDGTWFFKKRTYHTIFQSTERQKGEVIEVPDLPQWCKERLSHRKP